MHEFMVPELKLWVFDKLNECDEQAPRVWAIHNQALQQHSETTSIPLHKNLNHVESMCSAEHAEKMVIYSETSHIHGPWEGIMGTV